MSQGNEGEPGRYGDGGSPGASCSKTFSASRTFPYAYVRACVILHFAQILMGFSSVAIDALLEAYTWYLIVYMVFTSVVNTALR